jgi:hypothetical protein
VEGQFPIEINIIIKKGNQIYQKFTPEDRAEIWSFTLIPPTTNNTEILGDSKYFLNLII